MLRFASAGESHGRGLVGILEGLPSGLEIDTGYVNLQLHRRQLGYGRGGRMRIERDRIAIISGIRHGRTLGSPISFLIENRDWDNWQTAMSAEAVPETADIRALTRPRPGHVDLAGALKYQTHDVRQVLERASARETAVRVAAGAFCRLLLRRFDISLGSHVLAIGAERVSSEHAEPELDRVLEIHPESDLRCCDSEAEQRMRKEIDSARRAGDSVGGVLEVIAGGVPPGLGSHTQWDRRLDGLIAQALMSIPAAKAVEIGRGVSSATMPGSEVHDEIYYDRESRRFFRKTNRAGGVEGGISNGADLRVRVYMKPIPTLKKRLHSVDLSSKEGVEAGYERSDICVVPAAATVAEAMLGIVLAQTFQEKFGGDSISELERNFQGYLRALDEF
jgi:chorismate synthase